MGFNQNSGSSKTLDDIVLIIVHTNDFHNPSKTAVDEIQNLINSNIASVIYEYKASVSQVQHNGILLHNKPGDYLIPDLSGNKFIVVGGGLDYCHKAAYATVLLQTFAKSKEVHIPVDCLYEQKKQVTTNNPKLDVYITLFKNLCPEYTIFQDLGILYSSGKDNERLYLWSSHNQMVDYLNHRKNKAAQSLQKAQDIKQMKGKEKIAMLTAYDFTMAKIEDNAGVDVVLVGDSAGNVIMGYKSTKKVIMEEMIRFTSYVSRGVEHAMVVADMPYQSYETADKALINAKRLIEAGADAVKVEGGKEKEIHKVIATLYRNNIPVQGHIGYTPQSDKLIDKGIVQGKTKEAATKLMDDAVYLQNAGVFSIVLECVPYQVAQKITDSLRIPTIGIGAGHYCDGQVLVVYDLLGLSQKQAKFVWNYTNITALQSLKKFVRDVKAMYQPTLEQSYTL